MPKVLWLGDYRVSKNQLSLSFGVDALRFTTSYWYSDIDLAELERVYGERFFRKLVFHITAFEANKVGSLAPEVLDLGPFGDLYTDAFARLWSTVFRRVWAQWRYENDLPHYPGPYVLGSESEPVRATRGIAAGTVETLAFCGGGKDSLVAMRLLEQANIPFASFGYSHSIYGKAEPQHRLLDRLLDHCHPVQRHRQWIFDDFLDSPVTQLRPEFGVHSLTAAETPSSVFGALPLALAKGYRYLVLAHERSSDHGNFVWRATSEEVNHQWGKSLEAEVILNAYIRTELISDLTYFSILAPLYDVAIFGLLADHVDAVPYTHSCNLQKPWCEECPKCAYVWINYMAYLPRDVVTPMFRTNLLDTDKNLIWFRQMLGLEDHTPFECIGQIEEARLAFELCRRRGITGRAMEVFVNEVPPVDVKQIVDECGRIDLDHSAIPDDVRRRLAPIFEDAQRTVRQKLLSGLLSGAQA